MARDLNIHDNINTTICHFEVSAPVGSLGLSDRHSDQALNLHMPRGKASTSAPCFAAHLYSQT
jgi:hypothetical protein